MADKGVESTMQIKATNRKALRDFDVEEKLEAGIVLLGSEIKSIRAGGANLREAFATIEGEELFLYGMNIAPYPQAGQFGHEPTRTRKLLVHKDQAKRLIGKINERGYTLVPLKLYLKGGRAKVEIGLAKGRRKFDKRREIAQRDADREMARVSRRRQTTGND